MQPIYHNSGGLLGSILIPTPNGNICIHNLKKNDAIINSTGNISYVECIIKMRCIDNKNRLCNLSNHIKISPYYPIKFRNEWIFPINQHIEPRRINCDYIYNIILNDRKCIKINDYIIPTLGHNILGNIIYHNFFGTEQVILNLKNKFLNEYDNGLIYSISSIERNINTGLVCGYN